MLRSRAFAVSLLLVAAPAAAGAAVQASLQASRTSGVAPLAVLFDATGSSHSDASVKSFHDLWYEFDFGKTEAGENPGVWGDYPSGYNTHDDAFLQHFSKDEYRGGPLAGTVYEPTSYPHSCSTPRGSLPCRRYTASVKVLDSSGAADGASRTVEVWDPDAYFAGTNTVCIGNSRPVAGSGGCPAGAATVASSDASTIASQWAEGKRVLVKGGDSFSGSIGFLSDESATLTSALGAFGGGKPVFNFSGTGRFLALQTNHVRVSDLDINLSTSGSVGVNCYSSRLHLDYTLLRLEITGGEDGIQCSESGSRRYQGVALVESVVEDAAEYTLFTSANDASIFMGNLYGGAQKYHNWRHVAAFKSVFTFNKAHKSPAIENFRISPTPKSLSEVGSQHVVVGYNTTAAGIRTGTLCCSSSNTYFNNYDYVVEGNFFPSQGSALNMAGQRFTVRNNISRRGERQQLMLREQGAEGQQIKSIWFKNNTFYHTGTGHEHLVRIWDRPDGIPIGARFYENNLIYAPNASGAELETDNNPSSDVNNWIIRDSSQSPFSTTDPKTFEDFRVSGEVGASRGLFDGSDDSSTSLAAPFLH